jgi:cyclohexa-1,5-dienecarbonyl-CoA hydratase
LRYPCSVSDQTTPRVSLHVNPPVGRITLTHPPINVIDIPMMEQLSDALAQLELRADVAVLVLSGSEKAFSAGVDVAAHAPDRVQEMLTKFHAVFRALVTSRKVLVALVRGHCLGGGAELAMMCDLVITSESATWGFPEISLGCFPPVAATALATVVGQKQAADLILTGRKIDGLEAKVMRLANSAVPDHQVEGKVDELVARLAALSPAALASSKKAMYVWDAMHFDKGLARAEKIYLEELMQTEDAREGLEAFLEKRAPHWKGK